MREARALPGPPARALSDDPRLSARAADPKPILSRSQAPPHLPRADTVQTAMIAQSHPSRWHDVGASFPDDPWEAP